MNSSFAVHDHNCFIVVVTLLFLIVFQIRSVRSHGTLTHPPPRQPESTFWYQTGCVIGCNCTGSGKEMYPTLESLHCMNPIEPTIDTNASTWNIQGKSPRGEWNKYMPWKSPGNAKPIDSCGIASGFLPNASIQFPHEFADKSIQQGTRGTDLPQGPVTVWKTQSIVEASYHLAFNHGGGYQYRVCPISDKDYNKNNGTGTSSFVTEECFEANPLQFATSDHIVMMLGSSKNITIPAFDVTDGVRPEGSTWRRLPIPACNCDEGLDCSLPPSANSIADKKKAYEAGKGYGRCKTGLQFEASHLTNGLWTEGYGYWVDSLGGTIKGKNVCRYYQDSSTCAADTTNGCQWYAKRSICHGLTSCQKHQDEKICSEDTSNGCLWDAKVSTCIEIRYKCLLYDGNKSTCLTVDGCEWYQGENLCILSEEIKQTACEVYNGDEPKCSSIIGCDYKRVVNVCHSDSAYTQDSQKLRNLGTEGEDAPQDWRIVDKLIAPSTPGTYILQWRWDHEQTPNVWTTCADILVEDEFSSGTNDTLGTVAAPSFMSTVYHISIAIIGGLMVTVLSIFFLFYLSG